LKDPLAGARWSLLFGNFAIGCGVMIVPGTLNDISSSLGVSVSLAGQLIAIAAAVMCFAAPLLAGWVSGFDRRRLLALALLWYAAGHALCTLMPSYAALWPMRALTVLGAAVFTPQAAAAVGFMAAPQERGRAITFIFLGWSLASVLGMPMGAWLGETFGWRVAFAFVALLAATAAAWTFAVIPDGVKPAALSVRAWRDVLTHPVLMAMVAVTALSGAGQFTLFSYMAPYYKQVLGATPAQISLLFAWFGAFGLIGNVLLSRYVDRIGAGRAAGFTICLIGLSLLLWPLATSLLATALVLVPWALGCFSSNSAQQARLGHAAPALAPALMALNTSAIYLGQAAGAAGGGWLIGHGGFAPLHWVGLAWAVVALALSLWVHRRTEREPIQAGAA
jgi:predicted MFS family arabinose efflux permease